MREEGGGAGARAQALLCALCSPCFPPFYSLGDCLPRLFCPPCSGGCLEDDHAEGVAELDWHSAALLVQLQAARPGLFVPPPVSGSSAAVGLGDPGPDALGRGGAPGGRAGPSPQAPGAPAAAAVVPHPPPAAAPPPQPTGRPAATAPAAPPPAVRGLRSGGGGSAAGAESATAALTRALEAFVELPADSLTSWHVGELRRAVVAGAGAGALPRVTEPLLLAVARRLQRRIVSTLGALQAATPPPAACTQMATDGMECALVLVACMGTPGSVAVLRVEETCEAVIDLLRLVLRRVVYPARDASFQPPTSVKRKRPSRPAAGGGSGSDTGGGSDGEDLSAPSEEEASEQEEERTPKRGRGRGRRQATRKGGRATPPDALLSLCCRVVRDWGEALEAHGGPEEFGGAQASRLALVLVGTLGVSGVTELQLCACSTLCVIFRYYEASRRSLLTELLHKVNRLPAARSDMRRFRVGGPGAHPPLVRVSSALFLQLVHILGGLTEEDVAPSADAPSARPGGAQRGGADAHSPATHVDHLQAVVRMQGAVRAFVEALVAPAFKVRDGKGRDGRDVDVVEAVTVFVEDLLVLYGQPEWPAADTVVQLLFLSLSGSLQQAAAVKGGLPRGTDAHTRATAFAWLGALAAQLQVEAVAEAASHSSLSASRGGKDVSLACPGAGGSPSDWNLSCRASVLAACQPSTGGSLRLRCAALFWQTQWVVDDSRAAAAPGASKSTSVAAHTAAESGSGPGEPDALPSAPSFQRGGLDGADTRSALGVVSAVAASRWLTYRRAVVVRLLDRILEAVMMGFSEPGPTVRTQALKAMSLVASVDPASVQARANFVLAIRSCCMDVSVLVRDAALGLLCNVFSTVDSLDVAVGSMGSSALPRQGVGGPAVRRFNTTFVSNVLPVVSGRLLDTATSVRKRAVGILSQVVVDAFSHLLSSRHSTASFDSDGSMGQTERLVIDMCALLISRLADTEDSVRFASQFALRAVLFGHASEKGRRGFRAAGRRDGIFAALLAPTDAVAERTRASILVGTVAQVPPSTCTRSLVEVVDESLVAAERPLLSRLLSLVVAELLAPELGTAEVSPERARARAAALQRSGAAADAAAAQGATLVANGAEMTAANVTFVPAGSLTSPPDLESAAQRRIACSQIVSALAAVDADLVFPHCALLAPLLKGLDGVPRYQVVVAAYVLDTIERVIPNVRPVPSELVGELEEDLSALICTHRDEQLAAAAIKCICAISQMVADRGVLAVGSSSTTLGADVVGSTASGAATTAPASASADAVGSVRSVKRVQFRSVSPIEAVPETIARQFYQYLHDNQGAAGDGNPGFYVNAAVALVRLGLFCRYGALETATTTSYYNVLKGFASATSGDWTVRHPLREASLEGLAHVAIRRRDLLLSAVPFFAASLRQPGLERGQADVKTRLRVLDDLYDMLHTEDFQAKPPPAPVTASVRSPAGSAADTALAIEDDPDAGSLTAAVQALQPDLVNLVVDGDARIRHRVATILGLAVRQGVLLASALVSPLVGLTADRADMRTSSAALCALEFISSRYPYLLASRIVDGVSMAFLIARQGSKGTPLSSPSGGASPVDIFATQPPAACPVTLAVDSLTGYSRLSSAIALLPVPRRKAVFESLLKVIHLRSKEVAASAAVTRRATSAGGPGVLASKPSTLGLAFIASTLCSIDFGCAGIAGPSSAEKAAGVGSGTLAADARAKSGRDEVAFLVATAGRLVSSTGHSLFGAVTSALEAAPGNVPELQSLAMRSVPLSYLLLIKRHFAEGVKEGGLAVGPGTLPCADCPSPGSQRQESSLHAMDAALLNTDADEATWRHQLRVFCDLMDTDEAVAEVPSRSPAGARGRRLRRAAQ